MPRILLFQVIEQPLHLRLVRGIYVSELRLDEALQPSSAIGPLCFDDVVDALALGEYVVYRLVAPVLLAPVRRART